MPSSQPNCLPTGLEGTLTGALPARKALRGLFGPVAPTGADAEQSAATKTAATRSATAPPVRIALDRCAASRPAPGPHPLVVIHAGLGTPREVLGFMSTPFVVGLACWRPGSHHTLQEHEEASDPGLGIEGDPALAPALLVGDGNVDDAVAGPGCDCGIPQIRHLAQLGGEL